MCSRDLNNVNMCDLMLRTAQVQGKIQNQEGFLFLVQSSTQDLVFRGMVSVHKPFSVFFPALPLRIFKISTNTAERRQTNMTKVIMIHVNVLHRDL